ncbi:MAG: glycosyltransferase family 2 protein, partial [bacterium]
MPDNFSKIKPVTDSIKRPLWSIIIPTYNCANYLKETLESVLAQYPGPEKMEIIVVDDHSTKDDPEQVVNEFGEGKVKFIRQPTNVGKSKNYETGLNVSKGLYIHLLHGDDMVNEGFYPKMEELFIQFPEAGAAFCQCNYIDAVGNIKQQTGKEIPQDGIIPNWLEKIATWQRVQPPSIVFKREVYEKIGGYNLQLQYME